MNLKLKSNYKEYVDMMFSKKKIIKNYIYTKCSQYSKCSKCPKYSKTRTKFK